MGKPSTIQQEENEKLLDEEDDRRWDELFATHPEVMERLAAEAEIEIKAGRTKELIPEELGEEK